ncbi:MAG: hypothetical protein ACRDNK_17820 [Solirubrobacteraceae bacterium]
MTPSPPAERAFPFLRAYEFPPKPRTRGVTALKFAGGWFTPMSRGITSLWGRVVTYPDE